MSFQFDNHVTQRTEALGISNFLTATVGAGIKEAGKHFSVPTGTSEIVAKQVVLGLMVALAGLKGKRFDSGAAARAFIVGECQFGIAEHIEKHRPHYKGHVVPDDWIDFKKAAATESIALIDAILIPLPKRSY